MSPQAKRSFEAEWAALSRRLRLLLNRKHVPPGQHDDLIQETALRLVSMWDSVDRRRDLWPLTVTIALNLLRDRGRSVIKDELVGEMPELRSFTDVETAGIARMELGKVREAMNQLSESHRSILMREIGNHTGAALPDRTADKMLRMRARRKLRSAMEKVSGLVALRTRRVGDLFEGLVVLRETGMSAASCAFCLALGVGSTMLAPSALMPQASARPVQGVADPRTTFMTQHSAAHRDDTQGRRDLSEAGAVRIARLSDRSPARTGSRGAKERRPANKPASNEGVLGNLPLGDGGDGAHGPPSVALESESDSSEALPGSGEGDGPVAPPAPGDPPPLPVPDDDGDSGQDPVDGVTKLATRAPLGLGN